MSPKNILWLVVIMLATIIGTIVLRTEQAAVDPDGSDGQISLPETIDDVSATAAESETQEIHHTRSAETSSAGSLVQLGEIREQHGYYASGSSDIDSMHPYELYDVETLDKLADQDDGMAQIVLADKLVATDPDRADILYWQAAVNGKTAALVNTAASYLVMVPGGTGYGFDLTSNNGEVSTEYANVLAYYAAAEDLGDPVATELLKTHLDESEFRGSAASIVRICEAGLALADEIRAERVSKWGGETPPSTTANIVETQDAICSN